MAVLCKLTQGRVMILPHGYTFSPLIRQKSKIFATFPRGKVLVRNAIGPRGWMTAIATPLRGYTTSAPCGGTFSSRRRLGCGAIAGCWLSLAARLDDRHCNAPAGLHHIRPCGGTFSSRRRLWGGAIVGRWLSLVARLLSPWGDGGRGCEMGSFYISCCFIAFHDA